MFITFDLYIISADCGWLQPCVFLILNQVINHYYKAPLGTSYDKCRYSVHLMNKALRLVTALSFLNYNTYV